ncbi:Pol polyprotein [Thelohanellus kitauei]|uniref:Pol polyprotein n=1 Tax=Thelohanellus kitauei TaxID=669202 RepID=A0A0C2NF89_THEKT|nr:Pol polyprotein [Thelohanellus kitauei]
MVILDQEFSLFGIPDYIVSDYGRAFTSREFTALCDLLDIVHLSWAPHNPAINGCFERFIQTFKKAMRKSSWPTEAAMNEILMQYRRMPLECQLSPSELL